MRLLTIAICLSWFSLAAYGQAGSGSLSGSVSNQAHAPAAGVTVEAKNIQTGIYYKSTTSPKGEYTIAQLPAGTYQVLALNLAYRPFVSKDLAVAAGQAQRLDIQVSADDAQNTVGELGAYLSAAAKRPPPPEGPAPKMPDGKPDLSGTWMMRPSDVLLSIFTPNVDLLPGADAIVRERLLTGGRDVPSSRCLPSSDLVVGLTPVEYIQTRTVLVQLMEDVTAAHEVFLDGRAHPSDLEPTWRGHSIGKWDGDTLVIDTVGFNDKSWLFFLVPHTEMLHETKRVRRPDLGHLEIETTYEDPGTFKTPAKFKIVSILTPEEEVHEVVCENNQYSEHVK
jgi:Carboxypeptidase regulatory-like domain